MRLRTRVLRSAKTGAIGASLMVLLTFARFGQAQTLPVLRNYNLYCDPQELQQILAQPQQDIYIACELEYNGRVWRHARLRLRGDSSRNYPKKSLKINFDGDQPFEGRDKMNLNGGWLDATFSREYLAYAAFERAGLPASRCWFAQVTINGEPAGLYLDVEQVDQTMLTRLQLPPDGNLYKAAVDGAQLNPGEAIEQLWEKETHSETGYYDLVDLITWVDIEQESDFYANLDVVFDRARLARVMAINALICNSSTYYHNYYLLHDLAPEGRWIMLPWDMDQTHFPFGDVRHMPYYYRTSSPIMESVNALIVRCWRDEEMRAEVFRHINGISDSLLTFDWYNTQVIHLDTLLAEAAESDPYNQYEIEDFHTRLLSIPERITTRAGYLASVEQQTPLPFELYPAQMFGDTVRLSWEASPANDPEEVQYVVALDTLIGFGTVQEYVAGNETALDLVGLLPQRWYWNVTAHLPGVPETRSFRAHRSFDVPAQSAFQAGDVSRDTVWNALAGAVRITGTVLVERGVELRIAAGTTLHFDPGSALLIEGHVVVGGSETDSVHVAMPAGGDAAIRVVGADASLAMERVRFRDGPQLVVPGGHLAISNSRIAVRGRFIRGDGADIRIDSTEVRGQDSTLIQVSEGSLHLRDVSFFHPSADPLAIAVAVSQTDTLTIVDLKLGSSAGTGLLLDEAPEDAELDRLFLRGLRGVSGIRVQGDGASLTVTNFLVEGFQRAVEVTGVLDSLQLTNGVLTGNSVALYAETPDVTRWTVRNTVFWRNDTPWNITPVAMNVGWCFLPEEYLAAGVSLISADDPGFIDSYHGLFRPLPSSPLVDRGYGSDVPLHDGDGHPRIDAELVENRGAGNLNYVDIGLYELQDGAEGEPSVAHDLPGEGIALFAYPNPFNDRVRILVEVPSAGDLELHIYNILGRRVALIRIANASVGRSHFEWDGLTEHGLPVSSGLYFMQVSGSGFQRTGKLLLLR